MTAETTARSFFDDDDLSSRFDFSPPNPSHFKDLVVPAALKDTLVRKVPFSSSSQIGLYALHQKTLALYRNDTDNTPESVLELPQTRLKNLSSDLQSGFSLTKNGQTYEFYSEDSYLIERWFSALKKVCILTNFHDEYKALKMIGRGSFAKVYLVETKTTGKSFAVKAFTKEGVIASNKTNAKPSMINEIEIMRVLDHENIIKLHEVYETEKSIYLVLDLIQGKSLQDTMKKTTFKTEYSDIKIFNMIRSLLDALAYLASKGIMHRDLKPDNILLERGEKIKIVDFGLATLINVPEYIFKKCGTPGYIAPEVFKYDQKDHSTAYDDRCDVFSVGCIFYYLLHGKPFFDGKNGSEILKTNRKFVAEAYPVMTMKQTLLSQNTSVSKDAIDLWLKLMEFDAVKRISAAEALNHPYFTPFPSGMMRVGGTNEFVAEAISKYNQNGNYSPKSPTNNHGFPAPDALLDKFKTEALTSPSPTLKQKERFAEKGSLYLDMGKPEVNGHVDTLTSGSGSTNNSMLLVKRESEPNPTGLPSTFSTKNSMLIDTKLKGQNKSFKAHSTAGNQSFLKQAIFRNMQKNNELIVEDFKNIGHSSHREDRDRDLSPLPDDSQKRFSLKISTKNPSAGSDDMPRSPMEDISLGMSFDRSPSNAGESFAKNSSSPIRRFQPFAQKKY